MKETGKRKFPRLSFDVEIQYQVLEPPSSITPQSRIKNISAGGLCIIMLEKVKLKTPLKLEFSLPHEDKHIIVKGKVMWLEKLTITSTESYVCYDCGVEFVDINPQDLESINRHVMSINDRENS